MTYPFTSKSYLKGVTNETQRNKKKIKRMKSLKIGK